MQLLLEAMASDDLPNTTAAAARPSPAELLRERLVEGRGRLAVIAAITLVWLMDLMLTRHLERDQMIDPALRGVVSGIEWVGTLLFVVVTVGVVVSLYRGGKRSLFRWVLFYLAFSVIQVIDNISCMIFTAGHRQGGGLTGLWDVAAVYMESVLVFMFIYIFLDVSTPGGAFVWPSRDGEEPPMPHIIDYLFLSLNVNSTYGPTTEAVISRPAKLVMALQVLLAILILTVLISRAVSSTS